jgi:hypothetical protein
MTSKNKDKDNTDYYGGVLKYTNINKFNQYYMNFTLM